MMKLLQQMTAGSNDEVVLGWNIECVSFRFPQWVPVSGMVVVVLWLC